MLEKEDIQLIMNALNPRFDKIDECMDKMEGDITTIDIHINTIESKIINIDTRLKKVENNVEEIRSAANVLLNWADRAQNKIKIAL